MKLTSTSSVSGRAAMNVFIVLAFFFCLADLSFAHPLGNFTINHFARIEVGSDRVRVRYVIDMAEIPAFQELRAVGADSNSSPSPKDLAAYGERVASQDADGILLAVDGVRVPLRVVSGKASTPPGAGGLPTLRIECDLEGSFSAEGGGAGHRLRFEDTNFSDRIGWRELVVRPMSGTSVFESSAFCNEVTDELKSYPDDILAAPLNERVAELSFISGETPPSARPLLSRDGRPASTQSRDRLAELIAVRELTPDVALFGLLVAVVLGSLHALSPGHGKTVVGAYLVGSRGTARHAAFLGLTVTITHTAGVFGLGLVTLVASSYVVPERIFPILSFVSGALVAGIGLSLLIRRTRAARADKLQEQVGVDHTHHQQHEHTHPDNDDSHYHYHHSDTDHDHHHDHSRHSSPGHSHGGRAHSHLPPGADGSRVTWRSLVALGISGGILPCPSALVVLLAAISLHRVGYGLLLVVAFSLGLACTLTGIGLACVYARRFIKSYGRFGRLTQILPILSAFVIACAGAAICYESLGQLGVNLFGFLRRVASQPGIFLASQEPAFGSAGAIGLLGLGFLFGLKHATEVDHIVAVSAIVSEHRKLSRAALVGALWGGGHTLSLVIVGSLVLALRIAIPQGVASWLEFGVAMMIIALGVGAVRRALRDRADFHVHTHDHNCVLHAHVHFHEREAPEHSHAIRRIGFKPAVIGAMHGLAGSAALTLLVLTQIHSAALGLIYLCVFGVGSIAGMLLMSSLIGLPFALSARKLSGIHHRLQMLAGALSVAFGIWYAW
ncbi:MAG TPA: sulfite exporter TauE/SafE family protein [Blastocatellia bacterium]|nr:sulfite exporter TauE/SafE family protein [Blastocatellia bacterium]